MRAISLWQPWASAIAAGLKTIETRSWPTKYRGPLAIHAAARWTWMEKAFWHDHVDDPAQMANRDAFRQIGIFNGCDLPLGAMVAVCEVYECVSTDEDPLVRAPGHVCSETESQWGNYSPGRYGWLLRNIRRLPEPVPYKGRQGFFNWEAKT